MRQHHRHTLEYDNKTWLSWLCRWHRIIIQFKRVDAGESRSSCQTYKVNWPKHQCLKENVVRIHANKQPGHNSCRGGDWICQRFHLPRRDCQHQRWYQRRYQKEIWPCKNSLHNIYNNSLNKLRTIWNNAQIGRKTKIRLFISKVVSVLLYSCETWKMTKGDEQMLDTFLHKCLRRILKIYWHQKVRNETVRERAGTEEISTIISRRRWRWIGHVLRKEKNKHARISLTWTPDGKCKRGRAKETWWRTVERERAERTRIQIMDRYK